MFVYLVKNNDAETTKEISTPNSDLMFEFPHVFVVMEFACSGTS